MQQFSPFAADSADSAGAKCQTGQVTGIKAIQGERRAVRLGNELDEGQVRVIALLRDSISTDLFRGHLP